MNIILPENPLALFQDWLEQAKLTEINDPDAMALATCDKNGQPNVRMVLLKQADENGFKFHTNANSQKGQDLDQNPHACLCFHWKSLRKQIRVSGSVILADTAETDAYFETRPYNRKIGAHASQQSQTLESRETLEEKILSYKKIYPENSYIPRPSYWVGYRVLPHKYEFWWDNPDRLHDRVLYTKTDRNTWEKSRLYP